MRKHLLHVGPEPNPVVVWRPEGRWLTGRPSFFLSVACSLASTTGERGLTSPGTVDTPRSVLQNWRQNRPTQ
jgi:hypothetical protein